MREPQETTIDGRRFRVRPLPTRKQAAVFSLLSGPMLDAIENVMTNPAVVAKLATAADFSMADLPNLLDALRPLFDVLGSKPELLADIVLRFAGDEGMADKTPGADTLVRLTPEFLDDLSLDVWMQFLVFAAKLNFAPLFARLQTMTKAPSVSASEVK